MCAHCEFTRKMNEARRKGQNVRCALNEAHPYAEIAKGVRGAWAVSDLMDHVATVDTLSVEWH